MKIFVAGATGRVGQELISVLESKGHYVYAGARKTEQIKETENIQAVFLDLHETVEDLAENLKDAEAVIFVAGSRGKDLLQTDLDGAVKLMKAAESKGVKRYIQLSSMFALAPERWKEPGIASILDYTIAKYYSDSWLLNNTALDYTILQPGTLREIPGTGKIAVDVSEAGENSIEDVAEVLAEIVTEVQTIGKVILMHSGEQPIKEALQTIK
ncbi:SDR family oxidoreductase [Enterococcus sp. LJL51]|uniref:SDR family oxidoreductase n=1 Tax=Enterococcus sp. LJL51 TaxID=3416656 RepID=UPI003CFB5275